MVTSKGGIASWSGNPRTSLYVTHQIRNYWTAYRQTLPLLWWYSIERRKSSAYRWHPIHWTYHDSTFLYARPRISHVRYYRDTEPLKKHVCYLMCSSLTERRNQPVTGDIRFTVGKTTFKGGHTFLSVTARISFYVTAYITNCSRLYQRIWLLPRMYWYVLYGTLEVIRLQVTSNSLNVPWLLKVAVHFFLREGESRFTFLTTYWTSAAFIWMLLGLEWSPTERRKSSAYNRFTEGTKLSKGGRTFLSVKSLNLVVR